MTVQELTLDFRLREPTLVDATENLGYSIYFEVQFHFLFIFLSIVINFISINVTTRILQHSEYILF